MACFYMKGGSEAMRILLVDDHPLFLDGLQHILETRGYEVVATARNGNEALAKAQEFKPDVLLMDINMPECNGLEATCLVKAVMPECKIVMLTASEGDESLFEAIKRGASGYLLKTLHVEELFELLTSLERDEAVFSPGLAGRILKEFALHSATDRADLGNNVKTMGLLSERQFVVLKLVAQGKTYKEVAAALCLSERTIKYHMGRILDILHVSTKAQAISYAAGQGFFGY
jgi:DNA-binding NarL/FixJ family response regulator